MILITSANGNVGRKLIPILAKKSLKIRAMDINPAAKTLKELGAEETFIGDARSPEDMKKALSGCSQVLYVPPMFVYDEAKMAKLCIDLAAEARIRQFVFLSVTHPNMSTLLQHTQKLLGEEHLIYKGLSHGLNYTILQPMHYNHNFDVKTVLETNMYTCFYTKTTKLSYVDAEDVGEAAAKILTEDGHQNATYELVGPDFLSPLDMVEQFNEISKRDASVNQVDVEDVIRMIGNPDSYFAETFRCLAETYGTYGIAGNPNVLTWLLGRKPTTFSDYLRRELSHYSR